MKLKDYIQRLQTLAEKYPNLNVVYSIDDEGNAYHNVVFDPSFQHVEVDGENEQDVICLN